MPAFPHQITPVEGATQEKLAERYTAAEDGYIQVGPRKFFINASFKDHAEQFYNMEVRKDDVWIVTFPRSGTTWSQELVWLLLNDLDIDKARSIKHHDKVLFLEMSIMGGKKGKDRMMEELKPDAEAMKFFEQRRIPGYEKAKTMESPRCIKSHLMLSMLPPNLLETAKVLTLVKTCEPVADMRICRAPRDWSLLALQNIRTGKSHYLVICRCPPETSNLEGPMSHDQPTYASVPGIRVYGMMCVSKSYEQKGGYEKSASPAASLSNTNRRARPMRTERSIFFDNINPPFPWDKVKELVASGVV